jgi:predicted NUDIX family phosphoesterase
MEKRQDSMEERVLVFNTARLHTIGYFSGFIKNVAPYLDAILHGDNCFFKKRSAAEQNPEYKQIIPYVIFRHKETVFSYRRGKLLSEKRLLGNCSIGVGGHISTQDENLFSNAYEEGLLREINEEVLIQSGYSQRIAGLINDDSNDVGKVHFGVVHIFDLDSPIVTPKEKSINETGFLSLGDLNSNIEKYENWSKLCIRELDTME